MTEQLKAEAFVRSQRPALMERGLGAKNFVLRDGTKVPILNNINLQDWLAVLGHVFSDAMEFYPAQEETENAEAFNLRWRNLEGVKIDFNLTTGQPATEADYRRFNSIIAAD